MATITFYEKPGCKGNARQKAVLEAAGHTVLPKNLKTEPWTRESLLGFLGNLPVTEWFNPSAPAIKAGQIRPETLTPDEALALLLENPLVIRRPLMESMQEGVTTRMVGFKPETVDAWVGLGNTPLPEGNLEACVHGPEGHGQCGSRDDPPEGGGQDGCRDH